MMLLGVVRMLLWCYGITECFRQKSVYDPEISLITFFKWDFFSLSLMNISYIHMQPNKPLIIRLMAQSN